MTGSLLYYQDSAAGPAHSRCSIDLQNEGHPDKVWQATDDVTLDLRETDGRWITVTEKSKQEEAMEGAE